MIAKQELPSQIDRVFEPLERLVDGLEQEQIDRKDNPDRWSIGQVLQHMIIAHSGTKEFCATNTEPTERDPGQQLEPIRALFLDYSIKMTTADFLYPPYQSTDKAEAIQKINAIKTELLDIVQNFDLTVTCKQMELPTFGYLTRLEWVNFTLDHMQRHTEQIRRLIHEYSAQESDI